jgi:hypothetical protein
MKYQLERREEIIKSTAIYDRTAQATIRTFRWKGIALSDDLDELKKYAGSCHRIIDRETGEEVFRAAPAGLW